MRPNGTAIRAIRKAQKMGIRTLARTADIDRSHLSRVERGLVGASAAKLHRIADALQVPPDAITHKEKP